MKTHAYAKFELLILRVVNINKVKKFPIISHSKVYMAFGDTTCSLCERHITSLFGVRRRNPCLVKILRSAIFIDTVNTIILILHKMSQDFFLFYIYIYRNKRNQTETKRNQRIY